VKTKHVRHVEVCSTMLSCDEVWCQVPASCTYTHTYTYTQTRTHTHTHAHRRIETQRDVHTGMGWLQLVCSSKLQVSFAEYSLFYRALLQKRPIILRSLLIVATP